MKYIDKIHFYRDIEIIKVILKETGLQKYIDILHINHLEKYAANRSGEIRYHCIRKLYEILVIINFLLEEKSSMIIYSSITLSSKLITILSGKYSDITNLK